MEKQAIYNYFLRLGDSCLIMGQRLAEWCSNGPTLEEDLALSNISLDLFGQAEAYYTEAVKISPAYSSADDLAFRRNEQEYFNYLICEQERGNFADTMARIYLFSSYLMKVHHALSKVSDPLISELSARAEKELIYHKRHSADWLKRLAMGTEESHLKTQNAIDFAWQFTSDLCALTETDAVFEKEFGINFGKMNEEWNKEIEVFVQSIGIRIPENVTQITGGILGRHTEKLGHLLCEMQFLQRAYPDANW